MTFSLPGRFFLPCTIADGLRFRHRCRVRERAKVENAIDGWILGKVNEVRHVVDTLAGLVERGELG